MGSEICTRVHVESMFSKPVLVKSCDYRFEFELGRDNFVTFAAARIDGYDLKADDEQEVKRCLEDLGNWEAVAKALHDLTGQGTDTTPTRPNPYEVKTGPGKDVIMGSVSLTPEERHRRELEPGKGPLLTIEELVNQLKNVEKWRNLQRAINSLRSA
jgi:hypothetical protein